MINLSTAFETSVRLLKGRSTALFDAFHNNPKTGIGAVAAGFIAPFFLENDQRGYFKTALMTAPVIGAAFVAAPRLYNAIHKEAPGIQAIFRDMPGKVRGANKPFTAPTVGSVASMQAEFFKGNKSVSSFNREVGDFYYRTNSKINNVQSEADGLITQIRSTLDKQPSLKHYLQNAAHASSLRTMSASELKALRLGSRPSAMQGDIEEYLIGLVQQQAAKGNVKFIRDLTSRVQQSKHIAMQGGFLVGLPSNQPNVNSIKYGNTTKEFRNSMAQVDPKAMSAIDEAIAGGRMNKHRVSLIVDPVRINTPDGLLDSNKPYGAILGMEYREGRKVLRIPFVSKDGSIRGGASWDKLGVARKVLSGNGSGERSDLYGIRNIHRGIDTVGQEMQRYNILNFTDVTSDWQDAAVRPFENVMSPGSWVNKLRSQQYVSSNIAGFRTSEDLYSRAGKIGKGSEVGFSMLPAFQREQFLVNSGFIKVGSGGSLMKGVMEDTNLRRLSMFGITNPEKDNVVWRSLTKNVALSGVPSDNKPFALTDYVNSELVGAGERLPAAGLRFSSVTPKQQSFFGDLPARLDGYDGRAALMEKEGLSAKEATDAWGQIKSYLKQGSNLEVMRKAGYMGEGTYVMPKDLMGMNVTNNRTVTLDSLDAESPDHLFAADHAARESNGLGLEKNTLLGYVNGEAISTEATHTAITDITKMANGQFAIGLHDIYPMDTGAKVDVDTLGKGLVYGLSNDAEMRAFKEGFSVYNRATGTGVGLSHSTSGVTLANYMQEGGDPVQQTMSMADLTLRELTTAPPKVKRPIMDDFLSQVQAAVDGFDPEASLLEENRQMANKYIDRLKGVGVNWADGQLTYDTSGSLFKALKTPAESVAKFQEANGIIQDMFAQVSERIQNGQLKGKEIWARYRALKGLKGQESTSFGDYLLKYDLPGNLFAWDHTLHNNSSQVKVTYDMLQSLTLRGRHAAASEIYGRLNFGDGDPRLTKGVVDYMLGDTGAITRHMSIQEAMAGKTGRISLSSAAGRADTIFDPGHAIASKENFLLDLPNGSSVPVLSQAAHGGKINRYGTQFSANEHERGLMDIIQKAQSGGDTSEAVNKYIKGAEDGSSRGLLGLASGPDGYLRSTTYDKYAEAGFIQNRASRLVENGKVNPFQIGLSEDMVRRMANKEAREALMGGEAVYGAMARHPVSYMPLNQFVLDRGLKNNAIGIDEGLRNALHSDIDKDPGYVTFFDKGGTAEAEAMEAVKMGSSQHRDLDILQGLMGSKYSEDVTRMQNARNYKEKGLADRIMKYLNNARDPASALTRRTTGGTIGQYSNMRTKLLVGLQGNSNVTNEAERSTLDQLFFEIRQTPISAVKLKSDTIGKSSYSLAMQQLAALDESLHPNAKFEDFHKSLSNIMDFAGSGYRDFMSSSEGTDLLRRFHSGLSQEHMQAANTILSDSHVSADTLSKTEELLYTMSGASRKAPQAKGIAGAVAEELGRANSEIASAAGRVGRSFKGSKAGKYAAIGIAAAAVIGVLSTKATGNLRPETTIGTSNAVPGEPVTGSRAPDGPRRNIIRPAPGVKTVAVAPVNNSSNVDVRIKGDDPRKANEMAQMMSRLTGSGDTNTTINFRRGHDMDTLRAKKKIRDSLKNNE